MGLNAQGSNLKVRTLLLLGLIFTTSLFGTPIALPLERAGRAAAQIINKQAGYGNLLAGSSSSSTSIAAWLLEGQPSTSAMAGAHKKKVMYSHGADNPKPAALGRKVMAKMDMKRVHALRQRLGSRPPVCRDKCDTCFPCEAVKMVPTGPTVLSASSIQHSYVAHHDYSNYNPEGWKCKCGARIFNP